MKITEDISPAFCSGGGSSIAVPGRLNNKPFVDEGVPSAFCSGGGSSILVPREDELSSEALNKNMPGLMKI